MNWSNVPIRRLLITPRYANNFITAIITPSSIVYCFVCITEYVVWYRDEIDEIPAYPDYRNLTLDELLSATHRLTVTHMSIRGDIPPIDEIAPHVKELKLFRPPDRDQSDRSVSLIIHQYYSLVDLHIIE